MPKRRAPSLISPCTAHRYASQGERIGEFSSGELDNAGGLISLRDDETAPGVGVLVVNLYRLENCRVHVAPESLGPMSLRAAAKLYAQSVAVPELPAGPYSLEHGAQLGSVRAVHDPKAGPRSYSPSYWSAQAAASACHAHADAGQGWPDINTLEVK